MLCTSTVSICNMFRTDDYEHLSLVAQVEIEANMRLAQAAKARTLSIWINQVCLVGRKEWRT